MNPSHDGDLPLKLRNGARIAVLGDGPVGLFFSYFIRRHAAEFGLKIAVERFGASATADLGFGGFITTSWVQEMALDGVFVPDKLFAARIGSCVLHAGSDSVRIDAPGADQPMALLSSAHPLGDEAVPDTAFETFLNTLGTGVTHRTEPVEAIGTGDDDKPVIITANADARTYDLIVVASDPDRTLLHRLQQLHPDLTPGTGRKTLIREFTLEASVIQSCFGEALHFFTCDLPNLSLAAIIPHTDRITIVLHGSDIDERSLCDFLHAAEVRTFFPLDDALIAIACQSDGSEAGAVAPHPFADRVLYLDALPDVSALHPLQAASSIARAAASTAVGNGVGEKDFARHFLPVLKQVDHCALEVLLGTLKTGRRLQNAALQRLRDERDLPASRRRGALLIWDLLNASVTRREMLHRLLHPSLIGALLKALIRRRDVADTQPAATAHDTIQTLGRIYEDGEQIVAQGDRSSEHMFIIQSGKVRIVGDDAEATHELALLEPGEFFGEMALLDAKERSASAFAVGNTHVLSIDRRHYLRRIKEDPYKTIDMLTRLAQRIPHQTLEDHDRRYEETPKTTFGDGDCICFEGDTAHQMYLIESGEVVVLWKNEEAQVLRRGEFFGETALLGHDFCHETVVAESAVELKIIPDIQTLHDLFSQKPDLALEMLRRLSLRIRQSNAKV